MRLGAYISLVFLWVTVSCIDLVNIEIPIVSLTEIVVDGSITDEPGPYTVRLSNVIKSDDTRPLGVPVNAKTVSILDDLGNVEVLTQTSNGIYESSPTGMRGTIGRSYHVRVEMVNGNVFESTPDKMAAVGAVDTVYYEYETILGKAATEYGYRIFIDAHTVPGEAYLRWKFVGTYVVETLPQFALCPSGCSYCPLPCSAYQWVDGVLKMGYIFNPKTQKPEFVPGLECTCCRCWVTPREDKPKVNDGGLSKDGKFNKVEVGFVPINFYTFFEKYRVEIQQMGLSRTAYDYWRAIQKQKEGIGSLFQPASGHIPTNMFEINNASSVQGIFFAASVTKRQIYLDQRTHKTYVEPPEDCARPPRKGASGVSCLLGFPGSSSTTVKPADWKD